MTAEERKLFIRECAVRVMPFDWQITEYTSIANKAVKHAVALADELDRYENEVGRP